jgi:hypothetical protein
MAKSTGKKKMKTGVSKVPNPKPDMSVMNEVTTAARAITIISVMFKYN